MREHNTYVMGAENAAEMGRLLLQERLLNMAFGGYFPERTDLSSVYKVLDVGCGPGGWVTGVAKAFPHMEVTGIDISELMVSFAKTQGIREQLSNVRFHIMDALHPLSFPDNTFDIVNLRAAVTWIRRMDWDKVVQELVRVTKPRGIVRLTESDYIVSNSKAYEDAFLIFSHYMADNGYGFSPSRRTLGISLVQGKMLQKHGCVLEKYRDQHTLGIKPFAVDFSFGSPFHSLSVQNSLVGFQQMYPALIESGLNPEKLNRVRIGLENDLTDPDFCGMQFWATWSGIKPDPSVHSTR